MDNGLGLLYAILHAASLAHPWSQPKTDNEGYSWTHNPYMQVPKERWIYNREADVNKACANIFGPHSGTGQYNGCVSFTPDDTNGLYANIYTGKKPGFAQEHEEQHADGWIHPWPGFNQGNNPFGHIPPSYPPTNGGQ